MEEFSSLIELQENAIDAIGKLFWSVRECDEALEGADEELRAATLKLNELHKQVSSLFSESLKKQIEKAHAADLKLAEQFEGSGW